MANMLVVGVLLLASVGLADGKKSPPLKKLCTAWNAAAECPAIRKEGAACITPLFFGLNYLRASQASSLLFQGFGNTNFCDAPHAMTHKTINGSAHKVPLFPGQSVPMTMCPLELTDAAGEYALGVQGMCIPKACRGSTINGLLAHMQHNYGKNGSTPMSCMNSTKDVKERYMQMLDCFKKDPADEHRTNKETYWGMCPDMDPDPEKKNAAFANYTACVEAKQLRGAHVQQQEDALSNFGPRTSVEENFFVDVVHGGDGASLDAGADAAMCCMPWHGFEEIMNTTYGVFDTFAETAAAAGGKAVFHCEADGDYKKFDSDAGAAIVIAILVLIFTAVTYSGAVARPAAASGRKAIKQEQANTTYEDSPATAGLLPVDATPDLEEELSTKLAELAALQKKIKQADKMTLGKAFDPFRNIASLLEQAPTRTLGGLDGLRTISMFMIILAHSALLSLMLGQQTTTFYLDYEHKFDSAFVMGVDKAVDTFFLISGILMSYTTIGKLRKMKQGGMFQIPGTTALFTFLRFLRLTPLYAFVLFFYAEILPHMGSGPVWYRMVQDTGRCRQHWWTNLLYINNFHPVEFHDTCMSWTWYLANDMQFFVIGVLALFLYRWSRSSAYVLMSVCVAGSTTAGYFKLLNHPDHQQNAYYDKPWMRISPTFIGMMIGFALRDTALVKMRLAAWKQVTGMFLSIGSILFILYVQFDWNREGGTPQTISESAAYLTFGRLFFVFGVSGLIVLGITKNGGWVYRFLSLGFWEPLGKLTFGAYLVHPIVLRGFYFSANSVFDFNTWSQAMVYMGTLAISYAFSATLHVLVELPFANLVGLLMAPLLGGGGGKGKKKATIN